MKKIVFVILSFISISLLGQAQSNKIDEKKKAKSVPKGMIWIKNNNYIDETEVTNAAYREYLTDLKNAEKLKSYQKALPDTLVWRTALAYEEPYVEYYFRHSSFDSYPVVGITYKQALAYCKWRAQKIKKDTDQSFECRIPTEQEWEYAAQAGNKSAIFPWTGKGFKNKNGSPRAKAQIAPNYSNQPEEVYSYEPNAFGIYCMAGNIAEMVTSSNKKNIFIKGGSWRHSSIHCLIKTHDTYQKANEYTGFRCLYIKTKE